MEIVAEFTYNHLGKLYLAKRMVDAAIKSGATSVKIEMRNNNSYFRNNPEIMKQHGFIAHLLANFRTQKYF